MDELNQSIITRFGRLVRKLRNHDCRLGAKKMAELTGLQMQTIMYIKKHPQTKVGDLSAELAISDSSASLLVDRLVAGGWIERINDDQDRRVVYLRIMPRVRKHFERGYQKQMSQVDAIINQLPLVDRRELDRILTKLEDLA